MKQTQLKRFMAATIDAASNNRPHMAGIWHDEETQRAVSTDGHCMSISKAYYNPLYANRLIGSDGLEVENANFPQWRNLPLNIENKSLYRMPLTASLLLDTAKRTSGGFLVVLVMRSGRSIHTVVHPLRNDGGAATINTQNHFQQLYLQHYADAQWYALDKFRECPTDVIPTLYIPRNYNALIVEYDATADRTYYLNEARIVMPIKLRTKQEDK